VDSKPDAAVADPRTDLPAAIVVGVGDPYRRDDGVGGAVVDLLAGRGLDATLVASDGETSALVELMRDRVLVFLVDAVRAVPAHPGRVHRIVATRPMAVRACAAGPHGADIGRAVDLILAAERPPSRMVVFAVETADTGPGFGLSAAVAAAARRVADEIAAELPARHVGSFGPACPGPDHAGLVG
jgi:hydrogenase maturation protease